jgi:phosphoketolase
VDAEATRVMGNFLRDVMKLNCRIEKLPRRLAG